jgi:hypothetical protein
MSLFRRRQRLIQPRLQLKLVLSFVGLSVLALAMQFLLLAASMARIAAELPQDGPVLMQELPGHLMWILALSFLICLPLTFCVGVLVTFRIAGPLHRIEQYLRSILRGERPGECRVRKGDELQELCVLVSQVTQPLRQPAGGPAERVDDRAA